ADKGGKVRENRTRRMAPSVLGLATAARSTLSFPLERCRYRPLMSRQTIHMAVLAVVVAGNAMAQTPPQTQTPPPAAQTPPAATPKPTPTPVVLPPFPPESKIGFVDLQSVVSQSILGKSGTARIEELSKKLEGELVALQTKPKEAQTRQERKSTRPHS